jgi:hypothetical protein
MNRNALLIVVLLIVLLITLPVWPYSIAWGAYPSGSIGLILLVVLLLIVLDRV